MTKGLVSLRHDWTATEVFVGGGAVVVVVGAYVVAGAVVVVVGAYVLAGAVVVVAGTVVVVWSFLWIKDSNA